VIKVKLLTVTRLIALSLLDGIRAERCTLACCRIYLGKKISILIYIISKDNRLRGKKTK